MSHFAVLVIGSNVDDLLAPFQENNMGDCPKEYLAFNDMTAEVRKKYTTGTDTVLVNAAGEKVSPFDNRFRNPKWSIFGPNDDTNRQYIKPEGWEQKEVPYSEVYGDEKAFAKDYYGYEWDEEKQAYGYWENPNAKWDWWTIGGRYAGRLTTKAGKVTDQALVSDLDLEGMKAARLADRERYWAEYEKELAKNNGDATWGQLLYGVKPGMTREEYLAAVTEPLSVFAVLKDGKWYEKGEMGWFAVVRDEKEDGAWKDEVKNLLADLPADTLLTVVDCHI